MVLLLGSSFLFLLALELAPSQHLLSFPKNVVHTTVSNVSLKTNPSDILPTESSNNVKAGFDFTVKYANSTSTVPTGASTFTWGSECNSPHSNCFAVTTDTKVNPTVGSWSWLVDPGSNTATFQGVATLSQGTTTMGTNYPIRVTVTGTTTTSHGHYELQVYLPNANPDISNPIYQASGDLTGGSLVMH